MKTKYLLLFLMLVSASITTRAQDVYRTINGDIALSINMGDSNLLMVSNSLLVLLDYETSKVSFRVGYETFHTGIDSFDRQLQTMRDSALDFTGKLSITINTKNFAPQHYNLEGTLNSAVPPVSVHGNGMMSCLPAGDRLTPACTLLLTLEANLSDLNLRQLFKQAKEGVRIEVRQSMLEKTN